ncbi:hypothetical protein DES53_104347 [Roseimicrobium gellanilyticum]|uniref:Uncharacterized protein n=1 Tax=Roseimicrobium gellanilyticum TaxID=748857 RepID=A0A366HP14_9BACT|nr:hypothetical protein [Roseimicrobium gellanilyticum]RBP44526.1 hypothetical protein DES53_104347 [Roseimicrobium gellanilyticum]
MSTASPTLDTLAELLKKRLAVIADHELRQRDAEAHLAALRGVSEAIDAEHQRLRSQLDGRLRHFLQQASYQKALEWIEASKS